MIRSALSAILSHWRRHPLQLATLMAGLALATGLWSAVQAINGEARASYARAAEQLGTTAADRLAPEDGTITLQQYARLRRAGWQLTPVLEGTVRFKRQSFDIMGIDLLSHPLVPALAEAAEQDRAPALDALLPPGRFFAHPETARVLAAAQSEHPVTETDRLPPGMLISDISLASRLLRQPDSLSYLLILPDQISGLTPLQHLAPGLIRIPARSAAADTARLTDSFHLNLTAFGLLSFAVGLFIVQGTIGLSLEQRRGMIRTLRGLGVPMRVLVALIAAELAVVALISGTAGLAGGYLVAAALLPDVQATLSGLYGAAVDGGLGLRLEWVLSGLAMACGGTFLAGAQALYALWRMPLLAAPAPQARGQQANRSHTAAACAGALCILAGLAIIALFQGLIAGFVFLSGLMLGSALMLPLLIATGLRIGARLCTRPFAEWLWADTRAQLPGMSLALMALLLALATNIGVGTMVSSFRLTFIGWLDQRLPAEVYVTAVSDQQGTGLTQWLEDQGITVLPIRRSDIRYKGAPLRIYGVADDETYRQNWPLLEALPGVWDRVAAGKALLVNEQFARRHDLSPGLSLALAPDWEMTIAGIYSDYGNPNGQVITSLAALLDREPDIPNRQFGLRLPAEDVPEIVSSIRQAFEIPQENIVDQAGIKARSLSIFDRTFTITSALNLLTLGVAGFAMLTSLLTLWSQRLPQLAPVWAMGLSRRQLAGAEVLRSLLLAAITAVLALPLGLVLAWALLAVINVEAFGWKLPMHLFPGDWLRLILLALLAAVVAAALPARRLSRLDPAELLKVFANER
ncbi:FtsX-like permease family protein [Leisingera methylohalidivorans]|uniref:ABC transporter permease n=1 Tax=Leisingera methylohalidivorans DSM 14336 TaxID=999552 RepID=V9VPV4_9RHOB|nr:ABC transporter permease [Leisingera methylohalidivorans]AHD00741.1 ABC transporter permease [Leisingera methylohalidivorans DSM 14336]